MRKKLFLSLCLISFSMIAFIGINQTSSDGEMGLVGVSLNNVEVLAAESVCPGGSCKASITNADGSKIDCEACCEAGQSATCDGYGCCCS